MVKSIAACEVHSVPMTSTSGTRNGGFHQWVPSARERSRRPCMICVIGITEVLLARMVSGRTCFSISPKIFCLSGMSSSTASTTKSASRTHSAISATGRTRSTALSSSPRSRRLVAIRCFTVSRFGVCESVMVTSWPASANTCATPWPMRPEPMTAMRAFAAMKSACRIAAVGVEDVAGVEVRRLRGEEQQWAGEIRRLAKAAPRHAGQKPGARGLAALVVGKHPFGQRRAEDGWSQRIDGDAGATPLAAERLGDAIDRRLRRAIGRIAGGMTKQTAGRRHQDDLAAFTLLQHLPAGGARHQPRLRDVGIHHVEEVLGLLIDDLRHLVLAGRDDKNIEASEPVDRRVDDGRAVLLRVRPLGDNVN